MDIMNSGKSKTSDPHRLVLNLTDKIKEQRGVTNMQHYHVLVLTLHGKM